MLLLFALPNSKRYIPTATTHHHLSNTFWHKTMAKTLQEDNPDILSGEEVGTSSDLDANASDNTVLVRLLTAPLPA